MKKYVFLYLVVAVVFATYLLGSDPEFPTQPPGSIRSNEPGDMEDPLRRAYYTNDFRPQILTYYQSQAGVGPVPNYRLNYPPEEAQTLIRDQTRSTYLEEIVQPFRYSFFVNGFEPTKDKDKLIVAGETWGQKVTVKYVTSNKYSRVAILLVGLLVAFVSFILFVAESKNFFVNINKLRKWIYR